MKAQKGFVALLMIVLVAVGVFGAMAAWVASEPPPSKQAINQKVLMQAREALLAYVALSSDATNALTLKTRLPCPDTDGDGAANAAPDTSNCGVARQTALGLLPWKTLSLPPLRDADGECLWYAISGDFKDAMDPTATTAVNADTDGVITVTNEAGNSLATKLVAVVFAPGAKLGSQVRTDPTTLGADKPCATPIGVAATDAGRYLDPGNALTPAPAPPAPGASPPGITFMQLTRTVDKQSLLNDQLTWITADDYAAIATQRHAQVLEAAFSSAVNASAADGRLPFASDVPGGQCKQDHYSGFLPGSCPYSYTDTTTGTQVTRTFTLVDPDDWRKLAFYALSPGCNSPGCAAALRSGDRTVKAVLFVRGRPQANQVCPNTETTTNLEKWLPCVENKTNRDELSNPETSRVRAFVAPDKWPVSNDILKDFQ